MSPKNPHAVALGKRTSPKKAAAVRANGRLGGRPRKKPDPDRPATKRSAPMALRSRLQMATLLKSMHDTAAAIRGQVANTDPMWRALDHVRQHADAAFFFLVGLPPGDVAPSELEPADSLGKPSRVAEQIRAVRAIVRER